MPAQSQSQTHLDSFCSLPPFPVFLCVSFAFGLLFLSSSPSGCLPQADFEHRCCGSALLVPIGGEPHLNIFVPLHSLTHRERERERERERCLCFALTCLLPARSGLPQFDQNFTQHNMLWRILKGSILTLG